MIQASDHLDDYTSDLVGAEMRNPLSWLDNPPSPERQCLCGFQEDGSFISECLACKRWRKAQKVHDATFGHLAQLTLVEQVETCEKTLEEHRALEQDVVARREAMKATLGRRMTLEEQQQWKNEADRHRRRIMASKNRLAIATKLLAQQALNLVDMREIA